MIKTNKHIEIARTTTTGLSSMSLPSCAAIYAILKRHYTSVGVSNVNNLDDLKALVAKQPDLVFMGLKYLPHGTGKLWVSSYLEAHGIAHSGSPANAIQREQSKPLAKQRVQQAGLKTAAFQTVYDTTLLSSQLNVGFPVFVKPTGLGGGAGVDEFSIAHSLTALNDKLQALATSYTGPALVEEYLPGREFSVAVLKRANGSGYLVMPIEMKPSADVHGDYILSLALKSGETETPVVAVAEGSVKRSIMRLALASFLALGGRDYGRIDIRLDATGTPHFLEANLIPGLINNSGNFPKACAINEGMSHEAVILAIVSLGLQRATTKPRPEPVPAALV